MQTILRNAAVGFRRLRRTPLFFLVAVATLAIGIGGTTAIYSVVHALLLEPLPYHQPEELVRLYEGSGDQWGTWSPPDFVDARAAASTLESMGAFTGGTITLTGNGAAERLPGQRASAGFFEVLGVAPLLGRAFRAEEEVPGADNVAVIAEGLWRTRFGGTDDVLGRDIRLGGESYRIVGVMPAGFGYPDASAQVWRPLAFTPEDLSDQRGGHYIDAIGRLVDGGTLERTNAELAAIASGLEAEYPDTNTGLTMAAFPLHDDLIGEYRPALLVLLGAVGLVLLIACVNVANLLLVRALDRRRELAVRTALGAGRSRLIGEILVESVILALIGGGLGILLAALGTDALVALQSDDVPRLAGVSLSAEVLLFALAVTLGVGFAFGAFPAWRAARLASLGEHLKDGRGPTARPEHVRLRSGLVATQVAMAVVLLAGAALLGRSFLNLTAVDHGFRTQDVLTFNVSLPDARYPEPAQARQFFQELRTEIAALPGVEAVGGVFGLPLTGFTYVISVEQLDGAPAYEGPGEEEYVYVRVATQGYLDALDVRVVAGRPLAESDREDAPTAALLNQAAAEMLWPGQDPIGRTLEVGTSLGLGGPRLGGTVVGIVEDVRHYGARRDPVPEIYGAHAQFPVDFLSLAVHTTGDPNALVAPIRERLAALDPDIPLFRVQTMEELAAASVAQSRFYALLVGLFGLMALTLAAVGLYGVMAYAVSRRTREIGVRKALGADGADVLRMVLRHALLVVGIGAAAGLAVGFYSTRLLTDLLYQLQPTDPLTLLGATSVLVVVALAATYVPARRATAIDPAVALREDA